MSEFRGGERYQIPLLMGLNLVFNLIAQISPLFFLSESLLDIFNGAVTIPYFFRVILYTTITAIFIRYFSANHQKKLNYCINLIIFFTLILATISLICIAYGGQINKVLLPGFSLDKRALLNQSFSLLMVLPILYGIGAIFKAYLYSTENFKRIEIVELLGSIFTILIYLLNRNKFSINVAVYGVICGIFLQVILQCISVKDEYEGFTIDYAPIKWLMAHGKTLFASNIFFKTEPIIDKSLLSKASVGDLSSQNYAMMLVTGGSAFVSKIYASTVIKKMTNFQLIGDYQAIENFYKKRAVKIFLISTILFILSSTFIKIILIINFDYFNINKVLEKSYNYYIYLFSVFIFGSIGALSSNALYAINQSKVAAINSVILYTIFIPVKFILFNYFGIYGIINSTNLYYFSTATINGYFFLKIIQREKLKK